MAHTLTPSGPVSASANGQIIENLQITANGAHGITVSGFSNVTIRNCDILHDGGHGIRAVNAPDLIIQEVAATHTGVLEGAETEAWEATDGFNNIECESCDRVRIDRVRVRGGATGCYILTCDFAHLSNIEGYDFRGPFPRGQVVQFNQSPDPILEDFSNINNPSTAVSWSEDNVNCFQSPRAIIRRGLVDGNTSPSGVGVIFDNVSNGGLVEDVDAIRMGNGAFTAWNATSVTMRRTRWRENICTDQGRGVPSSGGQGWVFNSGATGGQLLDSHWFDKCGPTFWNPGGASPFEQSELDFTLRSPIVLTMAWEDTGGAFNDPTDLTDLLFWLDPNQGVTQDVGGVSNWEAVNDPTIDFAQGTSGNRPDVTTFNGNNILSFVAANSDTLPEPGVDVSAIGTGPFYIAIVLRPDLSAMSTNVALFNIFSEFGLRIRADLTSPSNRFWVDFVVGHSFNSILFSDDTLHILELWRDGSDNLRCRLDGTLDTDAKTQAADVTSVRQLQLCLNGDYEGLVGDVILQSTFIQAEADDNLAFLQAKWAAGTTLVEVVNEALQISEDNLQVVEASGIVKVINETIQIVEAVDDIIGVGITANTNNLKFGAADAGGAFFKGIIDEVRLWSEAHTDADEDIELIGDETNLSGYWRMNEVPRLGTPDTIINDLTTGGNDGSIIGPTRSRPDTRALAPINVGGSWLDHHSNNTPINFAPADVNTTANTITITGHPYKDGEKHRISTDGSLPAGIPDADLDGESDTLFIVNADANTFQLSTTLGGAAIDITDQGTGTHTSSRFFQNTQDKIDAGYTKPLQPTPHNGDGVFVQYHDMGTVIGSTRIVATVDSDIIAGAPTVSVEIAVRETQADPWTVLGTDDVFGSNFRFIRITLTVSTTSQFDLMELREIDLVARTKTKSDSGRAEITANPTTINFNVSFKDIEGIVVTPEGVTALLAVVDFTDAPNPTGFDAYLFDTNGADASGAGKFVRWEARGF